MAFMRRSAAACGVVISACGLGALVLAAEVRAQGGDIEAGKRVYDKANCVGCHKWHGGGGGGYGGAALSLRETGLDRQGLIEAVRCGRPGTGMPYHDRTAWRGTDRGCYDMTRSELGRDLPPKAATFLRDAEIEAVVDYVQAAIQGRGEPTREDCIAFWGDAAKQCDSM
jgi:mono/diheme cytochrome c family protein